MDHRPGERIPIEAERLKNKADFMILRDPDPELDNFYGYEKIYPLFKYCFDYKKYLPNAIVLSNFIDI